jgi:hypothetical protein
MRWSYAIWLVAALGCSFDQNVTGNSSATDDADPNADDSASDGQPSADAQPVPGDPSFSRLIDITDTSVSGASHQNFPLLVSLSGPWLRHTSSSGDVAHAEGFDISFSADLERTIQLDHEIEFYDGAIGVLSAWVRIPTLTPATVLYLNYGDPVINASLENAPAVWNQDYAAVWHLASDFVDSTTNNAPGTDSGSSDAAGQIVAGRQFDATDDFVDVGSLSAIDNIFAGGGTAEAWFFATNWGESSYGRIFDKGHASGWSMCVDDNSDNDGFTFYHGRSGAAYWTTASATVVLNNWHHVAAVYNKDSSSNDPTIYLDGVAQTISEIAAPSGTARDDSSIDLQIGNRPGNDRTFAGTIDEARLSTVIRSAGWIATSHANQRDPAAFYVVGPQL